MNKKKHVLGIVIDLSNAVGTISHDKLLHKLNNYGVRGNSLGVIIDENLKWDVHTKYLNSKLKCEIGKLNRIKKCIPKIAYKELYHTLFESHLSYGISAWGGISFRKLEP